MRNRSPALQSNHRPDKEEAAMPLSKAQGGEEGGGEVNNKSMFLSPNSSQKGRHKQTIS